MEQRELGKTGIKVSLLCLGTMTYGEQNTEAEGFEQMDYAVASGINFFDTAELYAIPPRAATYGATEAVIGNWLASRRKRADVVIASKVAGPPGLNWIRGGAGFSPDGIAAALDASLKRLKTDYIDLYQLHWPNREVNSFGHVNFDFDTVDPRTADDLLETMQAMNSHIRSGKIRHWGLSNETPWGVMTILRLARDNGIPAPVSIQNAYNLLNRTFEIGLAECALHERVGLLAYSPLGGGTITGKYLNGQMPAGSRRSIDARRSRYKTPREDEAVAAYVDIAKKHGLDVAQMAIAFVNSRPFLTSNIIGATKMEQLKTNIAAANLSLSAEVVADINALFAKTPNPCP